MTALYEDLMDKLEAFDTGSDAKETKAVLDKLKETHATSAGLKAFCTWAGLETIDKCRQACGGHGYSAYVNLASMYADQVGEIGRCRGYSGADIIHYRPSSAHGKATIRF